MAHFPLGVSAKTQQNEKHGASPQQLMSSSEQQVGGVTLSLQVTALHPTPVPAMPARSEITALHLDSPPPQSSPFLTPLPQASGERGTGGRVRRRRKAMNHTAHGEAEPGT